MTATRRRHSSLFLLLTTSLLLSVIIAFAEDTYFHTYQLKTADAEAATSAAKAILGNKGKVIYYEPQNQLLISASSNGHKQVSILLTEINKPAPNIRLDVTITQAGTESQQQFEIMRPKKISTSTSGTLYKIRPQISSSTTSADSVTRQTLLVQSGKEGRISIGQEVPFEQWIVDTGREWGYIEDNIIMEKIGASLVAQPRAMPNGLISVTLVPEIRTLIGTKTKRIKYTRVATTVLIRDGQTMSLGSFGQHRDFYDKFLVGVGHTGQSTSMQITLTPHVVK